MTREPDTPPTAEATLQSLSDKMEIAVAGLREARNEEVAAQHEYEAAKRRAQFSGECPKVGVFDGVRTTVAQQAAWVDERVAEEKLLWQIAKATRQAASTHLNMLRDQASVAQSIASSVRTSYQGTGR
jgi:hypothetical protein